MRVTALPLPTTSEGFHDWLRSECGYVVVVPLPGKRLRLAPALMDPRA